MDAEQLAWRGEEALLAPATRHDRSTIVALIDPVFREIGQSGRLWSYDAIVAMLVEEAPAGSGYVLSERHTTDLGDGTMLLTYRLTFDGRGSRRSSIWRVRDGRARILFHHGTSVPPELDDADSAG